MNTYSSFSFNLASAFLKNHAKKSACVSPVSLLLPLAAVVSAAAGDTRAEFAKVLGGSGSDPQRLLCEIREICNVLNDCPAVCELTNTIEGDKKHVFQPVFMENMYRTFGEKIGMRSGETDNIRLTNVTHFKDDWIKRFSEQEERFYATPHDVEQHGEKVPFLYYNDENVVSKQFMDAVDQYDRDMVNRMIEEAMAHYLHTTDLVTGMKEYCSKFGIDMDIFHMGEDDRIFFIADHKDKIERILSAHGV